MEEDQGEDRGFLGGLVDKIKDAVTDPDIERGLTNQAAAMPASTDMNWAGGNTPATGPGSGMIPGGEAAAGGALTDEVLPGRVDDGTTPS
jgi:hypothetical protein